MEGPRGRGSGVAVLTDPTARPVIAHRGDKAHFPENTFPSFDRALELGADAIEFDLRVSRDGEIVIIHDPTVDRTTDGHGPVASMTAAELKALDAGARFTPDGGRSFPFRGKGLRIPTLDEMLGRYSSTPLLIEIKLPAAAARAGELLARHGAGDRVVLDSTDANALAPFRDSPIITGASLRDVVEILPRVLVGLPLRQLPYRAFCVPLWYNGIPVPVRKLARSGHAAGVATHVWTINDPSVAERLWRSGVNGIISDDPGAMLDLRRRLSTGTKR